MEDLQQIKGIFLHLANELATKSVDDTSNRRSATLANEVEVEHALHGSGLHTTVITISPAIDPVCSQETLTIRSISSCCGRECE